MRKTRKRIADRVLAAVLSLMMIVGLMPMNTFALEKTPAVLSTNISEQTFIVGEPTVFEFETVANDDANTLVKGAFVFSDPDAIEKLEYLESKDGNWYEFNGDFGPESGFPMINGKSSFRVTFNKIGNYTVTASMKTVEDGTVLCSTEETVVVKGKPATLSTTITDGKFNVGVEKVFTYTTTANDDKDTMVRGAFTFSDPDAIEKLEYLESKNGEWYVLDGEFGPETGFPMIDGTSTFRVTFTKPGNYSVKVEMKSVTDNTVLCSLVSEVEVEHKVTTSVTKNEGGTVLIDDEDVPSKTVDAGSSMKITAVADEGYRIASLNIGGAIISNAYGQIEFSANIKVSRNVEVAVTFVKVYTVTIKHNENGGVEILDPATTGGTVTVENGTDVKISATPEENYRVSEVTINGDKAEDVSGENNSGYEKILNADKDYTVVITFAPNVFDITKVETENGSVIVGSDSVEYNGSCNVTVTPKPGYSVTSIKVNGTVVDKYETDNGSVKFDIENVTEDQKVEATFVATEKANVEIESLFDAESAIYHDGMTYIYKNDGTVTFTTDKDGIILYNKDNEIIGGGEDVKSVTISETTEIAKIELVYKADSEMLVVAHEVEGISEDSPLKIVIDKDAPVGSLTPNAANEHGYHNSDVTFDVIVKDTVGIYSVIYWITMDDIEGKHVTLYNYDMVQDDINTLFEETFTVDVRKYNSQNVKVTLQVVDRAGNEEIIEQVIKTNSTKPTVSIAIGGTQNDNAQETYYNDKRTLAFTIVDREDTFSKKNAADGLSIYKNGELLEVDTSDIEWKHIKGTNLYEGTYIFEEDGHYTWSFSYKNRAGLSNDTITEDADSKDIYDFYIDTAEPYNLAVSYNPTFVGQLLETITFGFYQAPVEVEISAKDDTAGIHQFEYFYGDEKGTVTDVDSYKFTIPAEFRGSVSFRATDRAGRVAEFADDKVVVIDTIAPGVTVTWDPAQGNNGTYFNTDRTVTIEIVEANFFAQDVEDGHLNITAKIEYNDGSSKDEVYKPKFTDEDGKYVATIVFSEEADYVFDIVYTDRSGNVYDEYPAEKFTIDKTAPVISLKYDNNTAVNENQFKDEREATITVVEHNFNEDAVKVLVNEKATQVEWIKVKNVADTYTAEVPFTGDAHYTLDVSGKDYADNANRGVIEEKGTVAPWKFTVDKSSPVDLKISYESTFIGTILEGLTFGFYQAPVIVKIEATDDVSGIDSFTYSYIVQDGASSINIGAEDVPVDANGQNYITFPIEPQFRGFVSFTATNKAGVSARTADKNAVVVDNIAPGVQVIYDNNDAQNDNYYKADRKATIQITEANFFGTKEWGYADLIDAEEEFLVITKKTELNDGTIKEEKLVPDFKQVDNSDVYEATVLFNEDADYTFDIKYTDRSGNVYDDYNVDKFTVDKIAPQISIEKGNGAYFNTDRTAKITVVEHNFRASDFDFTAEAYNVLGTGDNNKIDLSSKDYQTYLKNDANWKHYTLDGIEVDAPEKGDVHIAEITFDIEGNYVIGATYSDLAGNPQVEAISDTFCIDKSKPENLKITYNPTFVGTLIELFTFGFYQAPVEVTIEATDDIAGVEKFVYSYTVKDGASKTNVGKIDQTVDATRDESTNRWYTTFMIDPQFCGHVSFTAYDKATNDNLLADKNVVVVDNVVPGISVKYENISDYDEGYFDEQRIAIIEITEANFFKQDIEDGFLIITVEKTTDDGTYTSTVMSPDFEKVTNDGDVYRAEIPFIDAGDYTFDIKYTDRSGNVYDSYEKDEFTVDMTAPVINVSYSNNSAKNEDQFNADRTAEITIIEHNFDPSKVEATVLASANENDIPNYAEELKNPENWKHYTSDNVEVKDAAAGDIHIASIVYTEEAHYEFDIKCTDKAGNDSEGVDYGNSVAPTKFTLDKSFPTEMDIKIDNVSVAVEDFEEKIVYDEFYGNQVVINLSANCDISGLGSLMYQKVADVSQYNEKGTWTPYNDKTGIIIEPSEKLVIYFRAEDSAGNVNIIRSTGIVVDDQMPSGEINAPEIDILPVTPNENGMYNGDVDVDLMVVDPRYSGSSVTDDGFYSGLNKITYKIYTTDTNAVEEGTLFDLAEPKNKGAVLDKDNLVSAWSGTITVDSEQFNSNNVIIEITAVDNGGNSKTTTTKAGDIKIDITAPTIEVSYDNNSADSDTFFKDDRTATVVVTERNFDPKDVLVTITNTDGVVPTISDFEKVEGTVNGDDTTWTATIKYTADGDYEFDIAYTDLADNACAGETFVEGTVASNAFTIDHTIPVIEVSYDNNNVQNGNYYKDYRTATVVITEHNFNADRVTITHTATDDGAETTKPVISGWTSNGDKHTATISYSKDAKYTFDIAMNDKAGNASVDYAEETFFVDTTMPALEISGVANLSANNGDVIPVITYSDTNYDSNRVTITLTGANRDGVELDGSYSDIHNGRVFTFKNFAKEQAIDDIYTLTAKLTDKAGNTTEKTITFSVNRFGSTYALSEEAEKLNGTYVKEPVDVVMTETNADELSNIKITLFKDGETIVLKEDTDYKIDVEGGNGQWYHYTYTVFAKNFKEDGVYSLSVESDDKAGNEAKNDQDTKDTAINFGVDSTLPIINIENLESETTYALDKMTVTMNVKDNLKLTKVIVELDGKEYRTWEAEELEEIIKNGGNFTFDIEENVKARNLVVYAIDAAGNGEKISETEIPENVEIVEDFYVTTNLWVQYYTNPVLFYGSIIGVIVLAGFIVFLIYKKKKDEEGK